METSFVKILGVKVHKVTMDEGLRKFINLLEGDRNGMIFTPNSEIIMAAQSDKELKEVLLAGDLVVPDGIGVIYASKIHGLGLTERVPGIELMDKILKYCNTNKRSIFILGGKPGVAEKALVKIREAYPSLVIKGQQNGYFTEADELAIIDRINEAKPDVLFVALGAPRQEKWIYKHRKILNARVAMGVGGSIDVWAGVVKRAPKFFQKAHLEWFYRLLKEPQRIGRMMALPQFMITVILSKDFSK